MKLANYSVRAHLQKLEAAAAAPTATDADHQELAYFRQRLKRLKVTPQRTDHERFDVVFRSAGLVRRKELRAEWQASGLSLDDWRRWRNEAQRRVLLARHRLNKMFGPYGYRLSPTGAISILVARRWIPWATLDAVVPQGATPTLEEALRETTTGGEALAVHQALANNKVIN